jgi:hypothetical protein
VKEPVPGPRADLPSNWFIAGRKHRYPPGRALDNGLGGGQALGSGPVDGRAVEGRLGGREGIFAGN